MSSAMPPCFYRAHVSFCAKIKYVHQFLLGFGPTINCNTRAGFRHCNHHGGPWSSVSICAPYSHLQASSLTGANKEHWTPPIAIPPSSPQHRCPLVLPARLGSSHLSFHWLLPDIRPTSGWMKKSQQVCIVFLASYLDASTFSKIWNRRLGLRVPHTTLFVTSTFQFWPTGHAVTHTLSLLIFSQPPYVLSLPCFKCAPLHFQTVSLGNHFSSSDSKATNAYISQSGSCIQSLFKLCVISGSWVESRSALGGQT